MPDTTKDRTRQTKSGLQSVTSGGPQGSELGPVIFILYTNAFMQYMTNFSSMCADDEVSY